MLRITIAGGEQPFVFACPYCGAALRAWLYAEPGRDFDFRSEDVDLVEGEEGAGLLAIPINTDLPVHSSLVGIPADELTPTPFIHMSMTVGSDAVGNVMKGVEHLRAAREQLYTALRTAAAFWARGDMDGLRAALLRLSGVEEKARGEDPVDLLERALALLYSPIESENVRTTADKELLVVIARARNRDAAALAALYETFDAGPLVEHRQRVVESVMRAFDAIDVLFPALWARELDGKVDLGEYRLMRDDFDAVKGSYQDLFEVGSRTLAFTGSVANVAIRGDAREFADGIRRSLKEALKAFSSVREKWLADFPAAKRLYGAVSRSTRNDIGHRSVRYDPHEGTLVYDHGERQNYIAFLSDYLEAVRLGHYLLDVLFILDYGRAAIRQDID